MSSSQDGGSIKAIDGSSIHRITSGQVVIDLQTAVKELVENSLDAGATNIDIRFKNYGLKSIEVVDNGSGISETDFDGIGRKHHTSKLSAFNDLTTLTSFGFRGEALSSLCALCEGVTVTTATAEKAPMGAVLELDKRGEVKLRAKAVRQRGTTVLLISPFTPLPVRRKELERNIKREFGKALTLLNAYALGPCCGLGSDKAVRLSVTNQPDKGAKTTHISLPLPSPSGLAPSLRTVRAGTTTLWGSKALDGVVDLELEFEIPKIAGKLKARKSKTEENVDLAQELCKIGVKGLMSSPIPTPGSGSTPRPGATGRTATDRQFFYVNGRPCTLNKVQKAINEIYRTFLPSNSTSGQHPFIVVDFSIPGDAVDVNVTPDKRTILVHAEAELCERMKDALEELFSPSRSTYGVNDLRSISRNASLTGTQSKRNKSKQNSGDEDSVDSAGEKQENQKTSGRHISEKTFALDKLVAGADADLDLDEVSMDVDEAPSLPSPTRSKLDSSPPPELPPDSSSIKKSHASGDAQVVVIHTSDASWNRPRNSGPSRVGSTEPSVMSSTDASGDDFEVQEPPRKKRKSVAPTSDHEENVADETNQGITQKKDQLQTSRKMNFSVSSSKTTKVASNPRQIKLTDIFKGKTTRQELRSQLAGFARSGSLMALQSSDVEDQNEDEEQQEQNDSRMQEVDEEMEMLVAPTKSTEKFSDNPLFIPDEDDDSSSVIMGTSEEFVATSSDNQHTSSSIVSISTHVTTPPASSSVLESKKPIFDKASDRLDLTVDDDDDNPFSHISSSNVEQSRNPNEPLHRPEVIRTDASQSSTGDIRLRFDLTKISEHWTNLGTELRDAKVKLATGKPGEKAFSSSLADGAGVSSADPQTSEAVLSRVISKQDFKEMEVLGQFNLGFIVVRRREKNTTKDEELKDGIDERPIEVLDDLFIVDQHAADEKYNFETLQQTTSIKSQKLLRPRPLELTASDELVALENLDILKLNGFELEVDEETQEGDIQVVDDLGHSVDHLERMHGKLKLAAQPVSKSTVFDMRDLEELIQLMHDRPAGKMVRCSKARAMFAMRACRKSVMVGMPLTKGQMKTVVTHMGTMDQPWNCPHGRPTMRHLFDMANIQSSTQNDRAQREINWSSFA